MRFQYGIADQLRRFGQSIPLSDPQEQAALATQKAFLGGQQRQNRDLMYSSMARQTGGGFQHQGDAMNHLMSQQTGERMALDSAHLLNALSTRRQGLLQASQAAGGALDAARGPRQDLTGDFPALFGQLAQSYAYQRALRKRSQQQQDQPVGSGPGETPVSYDENSPVQGPVLAGSGYGFPGQGISGGSVPSQAGYGQGWPMPGQGAPLLPQPPGVVDSGFRPYMLPGESDGSSLPEQTAWWTAPQWGYAPPRQSFWDSSNWRPG